MEQCVWGLGNFAGDSARVRDLVLEAGALPKMLKWSRPDAKLTLRRNIAWCLSNFCRAKPIPAWDKIGVALPFLVKLLRSIDDEILADTLWAVSAFWTSCV